MKKMAKLKMVTLEYLIERKENNEDFKLVEVLTEKQFKEGHIPGAINIVVDKIRDNAAKHLEKEDHIIVYCASYTCTASTRATRKLLELGYKNVVDFKAGKAGWQKAGFKLEQ